MGFSRQEYWSGVPLPSLSVAATQGQRHHVDRIKSRVGKMKIRMWVGSEAELGELGAGFRWGDTREAHLGELGIDKVWDHPDP